ncbi:GNAT family N-acetyltransferase [Evansella cellulosilytica]|uniref:GCN5-related N-acetyltransferase n=1 Tax=Evansella cellulosilytica (strain ATCC 21833 / DSM 2522 / FERM P-1141 / JCM 9156 / N-4) TaxID=649639 RepID=E6TUS9_EVAC2|nr:GNAT family N-acetyltransferase [Evansella cellulosilytica]ADU32081.1 GCN5-related N-acetyltransferase [Evansella cellulosilytica DSM 2522]
MIDQHSYHYRPMQKKDIASIVEINHMYLDYSSNSFLLKKLTKEQVLATMKNGVNEYYVVEFEDKGTVVGYIEIAPQIERNILDEVSWKKDVQVNPLKTKRYQYIEQVATHRDYLGSGVGTFLYRSLLSSATKPTAAFVATKPIKNEASIHFHEKLGFKRIGTYTADTFLHFKNYESILYWQTGTDLIRR